MSEDFVRMNNKRNKVPRCCLKGTKIKIFESKSNIKLVHLIKIKIDISGNSCWTFAN